MAVLSVVPELLAVAATEFWIRASVSVVFTTKLIVPVSPGIRTAGVTV